MARELPVVFLAFANAPDAHLQLLKTESREIFAALQPLQGDNKIDIHREESSAFDELYDDLLTHDTRVVIFHYGGHANGSMLQLEGGGGGSVGLAQLLGQQTSLKLVFLNGCATKGHVTLLLAAGVPAVIATSVRIGDQKAQEFSAAFYKALAEGRSISQAFDSGSAFVEGKHGARGNSGITFSREVKWDGNDEDVESAELEWGLYSRKDCAEDLQQWRLPEARADWRVELEDPRGPLRDLNGDPHLIEHRLPSRTVISILCKACGTASTNPDEGIATCPVCASEDVQSGQARTAITDLVLPFSVSKDDACTKALEHVGEDSARVIRANRLFVPYWSFDIDSHTALEAERGLIRSLTEKVPEFEWEPVKDVIDLALDSYLVQAGPAPVGRESTVRDWYWELEYAEPVDRIDPATPCALLDRPIQSAFEQTTSYLDLEIEAEVADRVGGQQQRNVLTDTRYRSVSVRSILLPHWYVTVEVKEGQAGLLVNGQTGAVRPVRLPGAVNLKDGSAMPMKKRTYEPGTQQQGASIAVSIFSGIGIGLMVGILLGLAKSPVVGVFIGAVGTGLAALLGLNDRHFSTAKGLRIGAFGIAVLIAAPTGIYVRDHGLMSPSLNDRLEEYKALGYSPEQARELLSRSNPVRVKGGGDNDAEFAFAAPAASSDLFSSSVEITACGKLKASMPYDQELAAATVLGNFTTMGSGWKKLVESMEGRLHIDDQKTLLFIARDSVCGFANFAKPLEPTTAQCRSIRYAVAADSAPDAVESVFKTNDLQPILDRVSAMSLEGRTNGLRLLGATLCAQGPGEEK